MKTMLQNIPFPILPAPPSWYPGHMTQFTRMLPTVLRRTDVVLELRDARLPLTSINRNFEGVSFHLIAESTVGRQGVRRECP
jgi:mitochondrial GTPase 1